jgi:hypothetical protein
LIALSTVSVAASPGIIRPDWQSRVTPRVMNVLNLQSSDASAGQPQVAGAAAQKGTPGARFDSKGRLQIDLEYDCAKPISAVELQAAGMLIGTVINAPPCVAEGWATKEAIPSLASLAGAQRIGLPHYSQRRTPLRPRMTSSAASSSSVSASGTPVIDGNGITIMNADKYISQTGVNGAGITIGVISDDVTSLSVIQGRGELPAVNVVPPSSNPTQHTTLTDEGTMMLEEVYAVAPGASLAFCGPDTYVEYRGCVTNLITTAHATVISDDQSYYGKDVMSAQSSDSQALQSILASNPTVMLFSSSGNEAENYWQGAYTPTAITNLPSATCSNGQQDYYFESFGGLGEKLWTINALPSAEVWLAWENPTAGSNTSNFDLYVLNPTTLAVLDCIPGSGSAFVDNATSYDYLPNATLPATGQYDLVIGTPDTSLSGSFLKLIGTEDGDGTFQNSTAGAPCSPQLLAAGVISVGAVNGSDGIGNSIEPYSNTGPIQLILPTPSTLQAPIVVAPDAIYVDSAGTQFSSSNFIGTSAASPNSAAVAVLLRSAFPALTPAQTIGAMETGAAVLGASVPNYTFGYGRVDAIGALGALPAPAIAKIAATSIVGGTSGSVPITLSGTGTLTLTTSSATTTLVSSTAPGISVSPSTCGAPTLACSLVITPTLGQSGTANITVSIADGAKRTASATFAATVTKPTPPTVSVTAGASQSLTEGAATTPVSFTVAGTQTLTVTVASSNTALLPPSGISLTSGCGSKSALTCTATLTVASGQSGTSTITFTATDAYGQSGSGTAVVTVNAPAGKGGGSLDLMTLMALAALVLWTASTRRERPADPRASAAGW